MHAFQFLSSSAQSKSPPASGLQQHLCNSPSAFTPTCFTSTDKTHRPNLLHLAGHTAQQPLQLNMCPPLCISIAKTFRRTGAHPWFGSSDFWWSESYKLGLKDIEYYSNFQIPPEKERKKERVLLGAQSPCLPVRVLSRQDEICTLSSSGCYMS